MPPSIAVIGGDARFVKLTALLVKENFAVRAFGQDGLSPVPPVYCAASMQDAAAGCGCVVLPVPLLRDGLLNMPLMARSFSHNDLINAIEPGCILTAGMVPPHIRSAAEARGITVIDYAEREDLTIRNAATTAEGALQIAMERMTVTLHGCNALVIGYGRIGTVLADYLKAFGANVGVSARNARDHAWISLRGYQSLHTGSLSRHLNGFDVVFNTVPQLILDETLLKQLPRHCLLIDLAGAPGGIDIDAAKRLGNPCVWALALPGKYAPDTSAVILRDTLLSILNERGVAL
jgi:dipicolinate synthase subunit A